MSEIEIKSPEEMTSAEFEKANPKLKDMDSDTQQKMYEIVSKEWEYTSDVEDVPLSLDQFVKEFAEENFDPYTGGMYTTPHYEMVKDAIKRGEQLPQKVLDEYATEIPEWTGKSKRRNKVETMPTKAAHAMEVNPTSFSPITKEPWEMTEEEWFNYKFGKLPQKAQGQIKSSQKGFVSIEKIREQTNDEHKGNIRQALAEGKSVPAKVLKDYPGFQTEVITRPEMAASTSVQPVFEGLGREQVAQEEMFGEVSGKESYAMPLIDEEKLLASQSAKPLEGQSDMFTESEEETKEMIGKETIAANIETGKQYKFRYKVVELADLIPSHTDVLGVNPSFIKELQPRMRERTASRAQIDRMAANIRPENLLYESPTLESGAPIVGEDMMVESGNARILALRKAKQEYPGQYDKYRQELDARISEYVPGVDIKGMEAPVLVRARETSLTPEERIGFVSEANVAPVLGMSPYEQAQTDAKRLSTQVLSNLYVGEEDTIDQALRRPANNDIVVAFLNTIPANERATLSDAQGNVNSLGMQRLKQAIFAKTYTGEAGRRLSQIFSESAEPEIKTIENAMFQSLPDMSKAEALIKSGAREQSYEVGEDLATAIDKYAKLKQSHLAVSDYLQQTQMFGEELTEGQKLLLGHLGDISKSGKKVRVFLRDIAEGIEKAPGKGQTLFPGIEPLTREDILKNAINKQRKEVGGEGITAYPIATPKPKGQEEPVLGRTGGLADMGGEVLPSDIRPETAIPAGSRPERARVRAVDRVPEVSQPKPELKPEFAGEIVAESPKKGALEMSVEREEPLSAEAGEDMEDMEMDIEEGISRTQYEEPVATYAEKPPVIPSTRTYGGRTASKASVVPEDIKIILENIESRAKRAKQVYAENPSPENLDEYNRAMDNIYSIEKEFGVRSRFGGEERRGQRKGVEQEEPQSQGLLQDILSLFKADTPTTSKLRYVKAEATKATQRLHTAIWEMQKLASATPRNEAALEAAISKVEVAQERAKDADATLIHAYYSGDEPVTVQGKQFIGSSTAALSAAWDAVGRYEIGSPEHIKALSNVTKAQEVIRGAYAGVGATQTTSEARRPTRRGVEDIVEAQKQEYKRRGIATSKKEAVARGAQVWVEVSSESPQERATKERKRKATSFKGITGFTGMMAPTLQVSPISRGTRKSKPTIGLQLNTELVKAMLRPTPTPLNGRRRKPAIAAPRPKVEPKLHSNSELLNMMFSPTPQSMAKQSLASIESKAPTRRVSLLRPKRREKNATVAMLWERRYLGRKLLPPDLSGAL